MGYCNNLETHFLKQNIHEVEMNCIGSNARKTIGGILAMLLLSTSVFAGGPATVGTINVTGGDFSECSTDFVDVGGVYFLEINYDGVAPLIFHTRMTTDPIDTELGLFDSDGILVGENDDFDFPASLLSELRISGLPAGQYFLAVGLFNTIYTDGFNVTSNSTASGNAVVKVATDTLPVLEGIVNIDLNYNFNGIVHADEAADPIFDPDHPNGFRSISDRALDYRNGTPSNATLDRYTLIENGQMLDIVHLGNRNTVNGGGQPFDDEANLDGFGIQPDWLADPDQSGRQTTMFVEPVPMNSSSQVTVLFQYSNGGGSFDVVVGFTDGSEFVGTATGPDWFGPFNGQPNIGIFDGAFGNDFAFGDPLGENTMLITETIINLGDFAGMQANSISFENASNTNGGVAVVAANIVGGKLDCLPGDVNQDGSIDLLDVQPFVALITSGNFQCEGDTNFDGMVDLLDVQPFVNLVTGG